MNRHIKLLSVVFLVAIFYTPAASQGLLKKLKKQTEQKVLKKTDQMLEEAILGESPDNPSNPSNPNSPSGTNSGSSTNNTTGAGLVMEPPDVMKNIGEAEAALNVQNYSSAKFAVRQAMLGIEMEIGHNILDGLPESVDGLSKWMIAIRSHR